MNIKVHYVKNRIKIFADNSGSVMVSVLITFFFVCILVATILSVSVVNMRMKGVDRRTKDEFYYAENAFSDVYNGLGRQCSEIMADSYKEVLTDYKVVQGKKEEVAYDEFVTKFVTKFNAKIATNTQSDRINRFNEFVVKNSTKKSNASLKTARATVQNVGAVLYYTSTEKHDSTTIVSSLTDDNKKTVRSIVIENVNVKSNNDALDTTDYISEVSADIVIDIPRISFFTLNKEIYNYGLLANDGLEFKPGSKGIISGNVYAGTIPHNNITTETTNPNVDVEMDSENYIYGGIYINGADVTINNAKYIVSGGDIYIDGEGGSKNGSGKGTLTVNYDGAIKGNAGTQLWFENLNIKGKASQVTIHGDLYAANDLEINGDGSSVKISGGYYGYNDGTDKMKMTGTSPNFITTKEARLNWVKDIKKKGISNTYAYKNYLSNVSSTDTMTDISSTKEAKSSMSSSIIVNAEGVSLDMKELDTLLLEGTAYINHESGLKYDSNGNPIGAYVTSSNGITNIADTDTGESVALKTSQTAFLVPGQFIDGLSNPTYVSDSGDPFEGKVHISNDWFAKKNNYLVPGSEYKFVIIKEGSRNYAYCYLNFIDRKEEAKYIKAISDATASDSNPGESPTAYEIKKDLEKLSALNKSSVEIGDAITNQTRYFANGAILEYEKGISGSSEDNGKISVKNTSDSVRSAKVFHDNRENLYKRYRLLDTYMEPLEDQPLSKKVEKISNQDLFVKANELPLARFFWTAGVRNAIYAKGVTYPGIWCSEEVEGSRLVIIRSDDTENPFELTEDMSVPCEDGTSVTLFGSSDCDLFVIADTVKGIKIPSGKHVTINGFLASKGKIIVDNNATLEVRYDNTLINRRVNAELKKLYAMNTPTDDVFNDAVAVNNSSPDKGINRIFQGYLIYYLLDPNRFDSSSTSYKIVKVGDDLGNKTDSKKATYSRLYQKGSGDNSVNVSVDTDYNNFIYYENWKKGQE